MTKSKIIITALSLTGLLVACEDSQSIQANSYCFAGAQLSCESSQGDNHALMELKSPLKVEQPVPFGFSFNNSSPIESIAVEVVGDSMYMGEMPVSVSKNDQGEWQGEFVLAACRHPNMRWRLQSDVTFSDGQTETYSWIFVAPNKGK